jgi:hypothetical protein
VKGDGGAGGAREEAAAEVDELKRKIAGQGGYRGASDGRQQRPFERRLASPVSDRPTYWDGLDVAARQQPGSVHIQRFTEALPEELQVHANGIS